MAFKILGGLGRLAPAAITYLARIFTQQDAEVNECVVTNVWSTSYRFPPTLSADAQTKTKARSVSGPFRIILNKLPVKRRRRIVLGDNLFGVVRQGLRLRQQFKTFHYFRIGLSANLHALILTESVGENL